MPKRKSSYEEISRKIRKLEEELRETREGRKERRRRRRRVRIISSSSSVSSSSRDSDARQCENNDCTTPNPVRPETETEPVIASTSYAAAGDLQLNTLNQDVEGNTNILPETLDELSCELDADLLQILGTDPTQLNKFGKDIHKDVALRLEHVATTGLGKDDRKGLTDKYLIPGNCKLIGAPSLNPETKAALSEAVIKRDKMIASNQALLATAISSLGEATNLVLSNKEKNADLFRLLADTGRILCDCQHNYSVTRRNFIIYSVKREMKETLQNSKIDSSLFGQQLADTLKTAKAIHKSGVELKATPAPKPSTSKNYPSKNWKTPRKQTAPPKPKESAPSKAPKSQQPSSFKQSQSQRNSRSRR